MSTLLVLSGATATGKSSLAISFAHKWNEQGHLNKIEIINFDSLLFYRELMIGTARPSQAEMRGISHHLIGITSAKTPLDAANFVKLAETTLESIWSRLNIPLLVGGSGFYLQALLEGMYETSTSSPELIKRSEKLYLECGISPFIEILNQHDPDSLAQIHSRDHYRLRRAVEHWWSSGTAWSHVAKKMKETKILSGPYYKMKSLGRDVAHAYLTIDRQEHWPIIIDRTHKMIERGLIEEVQSLLMNGFSGKERALQSIGYKETMEYLDGKIKSKPDLVQAIAISTRQLAKAQRTWFNRDLAKNPFHPVNQEAEIFQYFKNKILNN